WGGRRGDGERCARALDLAPGLEEAVHPRGGEPLERLGEEQDRRDERERPGDRDHLLLTAAQVQAAAGEERSDLGEELEDARLDLLARSALGALRAGEQLADLEILRDRQLGEHPRILRRVADPQPR